MFNSLAAEKNRVVRSVPMKKKDDQSPATKKDIRILMDQMGRYYLKTEDRIREYKEYTEDRLKEHNEDIKRYFDIRVEDIRHDLLGVNKDKIEQHEDRIRRLERHAGLAAAR